MGIDAEEKQCEDGQTKKEDCNTCNCMNGLWACTLMTCPKCKNL